ncbi:MAG: 4'-phosphopantetheinyl transferase superfamily protein, partial [Arenibacter sp.]|nr:4'-phosphopantetheinyl transferase superfamily protein [Arenibacter sp.]
IVFVKSYNIGIDIEKIQYNLDVLSLARSFFSDQEVSLLENISIKEKFLTFYRCWTRKEAFVKAEGSGLSFPLNSFSVSMDSDSRANFLDATHSLPNKNKWSLFSFRPSSNYISAIAVMGKVNTIKYLDLDNPSLEDYSPT